MHRWKRARGRSGRIAVAVHLGLAVCIALSTLLTTDVAEIAEGQVPKNFVRIVLRDGVLQGQRFGPAHGGVFLGIPYAAPPIGNLRWRPPQHPQKWSGTLSADHYGPACPQLPSPWLPEMLGRSQMKTDEECLYLNVWTPDLTASQKLPVMVWVHGGGNVEGSQEWPPLGAPLAARGVVVVTINYRLGILGFLAHPELSAESPDHASGNYGLLDQMAALRWVKNNIDRFGGDPHRVTVFGASSGSLDICDLMASPLAAGLFEGAILQSGVCVDSLARSLPEAENAGASLTAEIIGDRKSDSIAALRALPAEVLVHKAAAAKNADFDPIVDHWVLPEQPLQAFAHRHQAKVPVIVGSNLDEVSIFASPLVGGKSYRPKTMDEYRNWLSKEFHSDAEQVFEAYPARTDAEIPAAFLAMDTDYEFGFGSDLLAREVASTGQRAYLYIFTKAGREAFASLGAFHSEESMYLSQRYWTSWVKSPDDAELSQAIISYWIEFAKAGNPSSPELPPWPAYQVDAPMAQELGSQVKQTRVPREGQMKVFERILNSRIRSALASR